MEKRLEIQIDGEEYYLSTNLPEDYIKSLVKYLNRYIENYPEPNLFDKRKKALLTSINLMNDHWKYRYINLYRLQNLINKIDNILYHNQADNNYDNDI